jgi:streptomycin 6-kinase
VTDVPADAMQRQLEQWDLRPDGHPVASLRSHVLPVQTAEGTAAVLKISSGGIESEHEHLVLRRWGGTGAVRLLRADPHRRALLLERAGPAHLDSLSDYEAATVIAGLYGRIHVPALPQLPALATQVDGWLADFAALPRNAPIPHRLVEQAASLGRDLTTDSVEAVVLHGNLHPGNVLAADREPWLVISPRAVNGDRHYEVAPLLWHRWDDLAGYVRDGVRSRFYTVVDAAGLDEDRAKGWAIVRVVHAAVREMQRGATADPAMLTKFIALAKAIQD